LIEEELMGELESKINKRKIPLSAVGEERVTKRSDGRVSRLIAIQSKI